MNLEVILEALGFRVAVGNFDAGFKFNAEHPFDAVTAVLHDFDLLRFQFGEVLLSLLKKHQKEV